MGDNIKPFLTYEEQIKKIKSKKFIIDNEDEIITFLKTKNYYRLSAYYKPCLDKGGENTSFKKVIDAYEFDMKMRAILFEIIEEIEIFWKAQISYSFSEIRGATAYLNEDNFNNFCRFDEFMTHINEIKGKYSKDLVIKHHIENYNDEIPMWVIIEFFTTGMVSKFYYDMVAQDRKAVVRNVYGSDFSESQLASWLKCFTELRNKVAHFTRLYNWSFKSIPAYPKECTFKADETLFTQIMMLKFLYVDDNKWNNVFLVKLQSLVEEYENDIELSCVGFKANYLKRLQK